MELKHSQTLLNANKSTMVILNCLFFFSVIKNLAKKKKKSFFLTFLSDTVAQLLKFSVASTHPNRKLWRVLTICL